MGRISALTQDPRHPGAVRVQLDGRPWCTVTAADAAQAGLGVGAEVSEAQRAQVAALADAESAYRAVLAALARRAFATPDLRRRLVRRGHPAEAVDRAIARAWQAGLLNDDLFARQYIESRAARGRGPGRLRRDLGALGLPDDLIERALGVAWPVDTPAEVLADRLARRRAAQLGDLPRPVKTRRLLAFLARRGFSGSRMRELVRQVVAEA